MFNDFINYDKCRTSGGPAENFSSENFPSLSADILQQGEYFDVGANNITDTTTAVNDNRAFIRNTDAEGKLLIDAQYPLFAPESPLTWVSADSGFTSGSSKSQTLSPLLIDDLQNYPFPSADASSAAIAAENSLGIIADRPPTPSISSILRLSNMSIDSPYFPDTKNYDTTPAQNPNFEDPYLAADSTETSDKVRQAIDQFSQALWSKWPRGSEEDITASCSQPQRNRRATFAAIRSNPYLSQPPVVVPSNVFQYQIQAADVAPTFTAPSIGTPRRRSSTISFDNMHNQYHHNNHDHIRLDYVKVPIVAPAISRPSTPDDANFQCPIKGCGKSFNRSFNLKSHLKTHIGIKNHACEFEGCNATFARNHDLQRHRRIHTGERPYLCAICGKGFTRLDAMNRHMKSDKDPNCVMLRKIRANALTIASPAIPSLCHPK